MCNYLDDEPSILKWSSESIEIPYVSPIDNKLHRYYPDFYFEQKTANGIKKYVVEVKPNAQLQRPKKPKINRESAIRKYNEALQVSVINHTKGKYAQQWCEKRGMTFFFATEKNWNKLFR